MQYIFLAVGRCRRSDERQFFVLILRLRLLKAGGFCSASDSSLACFDFLINKLMAFWSSWMVLKREPISGRQFKDSYCRARECDWQCSWNCLTPVFSAEKGPFEWTVWTPMPWVARWKCNAGWLGPAGVCSQETGQIRQKGFLEKLPHASLGEPLRTGKQQPSFQEQAEHHVGLLDDCRV